MLHINIHGIRIHLRDAIEIAVEVNLNRLSIVGGRYMGLHAQCDHASAIGVHHPVSWLSHTELDRHTPVGYDTEPVLCHPRETFLFEDALLLTVWTIPSDRGFHCDACGI